MNFYKFKGLLFFLLLLQISSCQEKELELTLIETACKNFKIHTPTYTWILDPSCGNNMIDGQIDITFGFTGDHDCIDKIFVSPKFYKSSNAEIPNVSYINSFLTTDTLVTFSENNISIQYKFKFATLQDADALNHVYFKINTENELGNRSKNLEIRINGKCSTVDANTYTLKKEVTADTTFTEVFLKDVGEEDGDIVSIFLNGKWVLENYSLTNLGETFRFPIRDGDNHLVLFAVNEGKVGPNTVSIAINGTQVDLSPDLLKGEAVNIKKL